MDEDSKLNFPFPEPKKKHDEQIDESLAVNLVRQKIDNILNDEPSAKTELNEITETPQRISKHQKFISDLFNSGKSLEQIQTAWHQYYVTLSDEDKFQVWEEFYASKNQALSQFRQPKPKTGEQEDDMPVSNYLNKRKKLALQKSKRTSHKPKKATHVDSIEANTEQPKTELEIKQEIVSKLATQGYRETKWRERRNSVLFGLGFGLLVVFIFLFSFFNDRFIAPFITPSRNVSAQSIIIDPNSVTVGSTPMIIIPKINVEIPVIYNAPNIDSNTIETALESGVVHYPTTPYPGQLGNGVIFGHSSNNILNPGHYKFAFVLLHDIKPGDTFMLTYNGKVYVYEVYKTSIVNPDNTSVLDTQDQPATMTLITCDPPGTSINRLVVVGKQISPDPTTDTQSSVNQNLAQKPTILPSNSPSLWSRIVHWF